MKVVERVNDEKKIDILEHNAPTYEHSYGGLVKLVAEARNGVVVRYNEPCIYFTLVSND